jgi:hypothetical protein
MNSNRGATGTRKVTRGSRLSSLSSPGVYLVNAVARYAGFAWMAGAPGDGALGAGLLNRDMASHGLEPDIEIELGVVVSVSGRGGTIRVLLSSRRSPWRGGCCWTVTAAPSARKATGAPPLVRSAARAPTY